MRQLEKATFFLEIVVEVAIKIQITRHTEIVEASAPNEVYGFTPSTESEGRLKRPVKFKR